MAENEVDAWADFDDVQEEVIKSAPTEDCVLKVRIDPWEHDAAWAKYNRWSLIVLEGPWERHSLLHNMTLPTAIVAGGKSPYFALQGMKMAAKSCGMKEATLKKKPSASGVEGDLERQARFAGKVAFIKFTPGDLRTPPSTYSDTMWISEQEYVAKLPFNGRLRKTASATSSESNASQDAAILW